MSTIITIPHRTLRATARPVTQVDRKLQEIVADLSATLVASRNPKGVGLAAPQIDITLRLFATRVPDAHDKQHHPLIFINPRIVQHSATTTLGGTPDEPFLEGCLSIPQVFGAVWRYEEITVEFETIVGDALQSTTAVFTDFPARVIQHELDHLDGILFIDRTIEAGLPLYRGKQRSDALEELDDVMVRALMSQSRS